MYPTASSGGSNIGTLLRLIQEDQNNSLLANNPASQPGSPIRGTVQGPLQSPNDPTSARVVSMRPEGVTQSGPQASPVGEVPGNVVSAAQPIAAAAPVSSITPNFSSSPVSQPSAQLNQNVSSNTNTSPVRQPSYVATRIMPTVAGTSTSAPKLQPNLGATKSNSSASFTPQKSRIGTIISQLPQFLQSLYKQTASAKSPLGKYFPTI